MGFDEFAKDARLYGFDPCKIPDRYAEAFGVETRRDLPGSIRESNEPCESRYGARARVA